jgi:isoquinoline 1-oxidoreductase alpha subunit
MIELTINGTTHQLDIDPKTPLLWVLRDHLKLTGTKYGCGIQNCGSCTVHINGKAVRSCGETLEEVAGKKVTTIEGLSKDNQHPVQRAWAEIDVPQCGYCQPGLIMATAAFLKMMPEPEDQMIDRLLTNICRCGTYNEVRAAIHRAAEIQKEEA